MRQIDYLILHTTAGPQNQKVSVILNYWKSIGWKYPGYHFMIEKDGRIARLLPIEMVSNGVKGYNHNSIHICTIGGVEIIKGLNDKGKPINVVGKALDNRTEEQKKSQIELLEALTHKFPKAAIRGHRDFSVDKNRDGKIMPNEWMKTCPSYPAREWALSVGFKAN